MDYHRDATPLRLREYGRHVQRMVEMLPTIADATQREQMAHEIVRVMAIVAPSTKEVADFKKKLWDHLQVVADYNLPVEPPTGRLERPAPDVRLPRLTYSQGRSRLRQYGRHIDLMIERAMAMEAGPAREAYARWIAGYMKLALHARHAHSDNAVLDQQVWDQLFQLSKGELRRPADAAPLPNPQSVISRTPISNASASVYTRRSKKAAQRAKFKDKLKKKPYGGQGQGSPQGGGHGGGQGGGQQGKYQGGKPFRRDRFQKGPRPQGGGPSGGGEG